MVYYCSTFSPFTTRDVANLTALKQKNDDIVILFLNTTFTLEETAAYFNVIFSSLGMTLPYIQISEDELNTVRDVIYFDGLLARGLQTKFPQRHFFPIVAQYGYELLPFATTHIFDDVPKLIADFIIDRALFNITVEMARVYKNMSYDRFQHTMRVRYLITKLARTHALNVKDAQFAGLFHDYAKELDKNELSTIMHRDFPLYIDAPAPAWHGFVGAELVRDMYGANVVNEAVYEAIAFHTVGISEYGRIGLALFIADFCDYRRKFTAEITYVWQEAQMSLYGGAYAKILQMQLYLEKNQRKMYRTTEDMLAWLSTKCKKRE